MRDVRGLQASDIFLYHILRSSGKLELQKRYSILYTGVITRMYCFLGGIQEMAYDDIIYKKEKDTEIRNGRTYYGPHRDDLMIYISSGQPFDDSAAEQTENGENAIGEFAARTFGSQGQQRSAVLAIKLAEGEICKSITGEYPVFLFDDLLGELDNERRSCLASLIRDRQAIITCCDRDAMPEMKNIASVRVADGRYYKE